MESKAPEQLDWLKGEDKKRDEDERMRLEMAYGVGAGSAPLNEKDRKNEKKDKENKIARMRAELRKLLK